MRGGEKHNSRRPPVWCQLFTSASQTNLFQEVDTSLQLNSDRVLTVSTACTKSSHTIIQISSLNLTTSIAGAALVNCVGVSKSLTVGSRRAPSLPSSCPPAPPASQSSCQPASQPASQSGRFPDSPTLRPSPKAEFPVPARCGGVVHGEPEAEV